MPSLWKPIAVVLAATVVLGGCAVYQPVPRTYARMPVYRDAGPGGPVYEESSPAYVESAPVYVQPAPVYVAPPITFGLNFGFWGGHGWHHRH